MYGPALVWHTRVSEFNAYHNKHKETTKCFLLETNSNTLTFTSFFLNKYFPQPFLALNSLMLLTGILGKGKY